MSGVFGGLGTSESSAKETNIQVSGSGQYNEKANVVQGEGKGAIGKGAQFAESGAVLLGSGSKLNTGFDFSKLKLGNGATVSLNFEGGGEEIAALAADFQDTLAALSAENASSVSSAIESGAESSKSLAASITATVGEALSKITALAESKQTDGLSQVAKLFFGILVVGGLIGLAALLRRRKQ